MLLLEARNPIYRCTVDEFRHFCESNYIVVRVTEGIYWEHAADYVSVRHGWLGLVKETFQRLMDIGWSRTFDDVKSKFGTLRIHLSPQGRPMDDMSTVLYWAHRLSQKICEQCGCPGSMERDHAGWVEVVCDYCQQHTHVLNKHR